MNIDKEKLKELLISAELKEEKYNEAFLMIQEIASYVASKVFYLRDEEKEDAVQEAMVSCWKKIDQKKYNKKTENPYGFFYKNSYFAISDLVRKKYRREQKVKFVSLELFNNV